MPSKAVHVWKLSEVEAYLEQYSFSVLSLDLVNTHKDEDCTFTTSDPA